MGIAGTVPPGPRGQLGRHSQRQPEFIDSVFRIMRTDAPWHDLLPDYGDRSNTHCCLARQGHVGKAFRNPDDERLVVDASHRKVHASAARGGNQEMSRTKGGETQNRIWPHRACRLSHKVQEQIVKRQTA